MVSLERIENAGERGAVLVHVDHQLVCRPATVSDLGDQTPDSAAIIAHGTETSAPISTIQTIADSSTAAASRRKLWR